MSVPGPYTLSGRLIPSERYPDRWAITEALVPIVRAELVAVVEAGCTELAIDEPSMSCYAYREDPDRFVDIFNRTVEPVVGRCRLSTHLCFGNYKARAAAPRRYAPMFPAFLGFSADELHVEMASRELAESELVGTVAERKDVAVGIVDVKSSWVEPADEIVARVRHFLGFAPPERLSLSTDCGLSQTARWAARGKLATLCTGVAIVREELGL
jgi:5-methyltetrahydropteroyltriglutamate--homocysteine methyltransferase